MRTTQLLVVCITQVLIVALCSAATVAAQPTITSISPRAIQASNNRQTVYVRGRNFDAGAVVNLQHLPSGEWFPNRPIYSRSRSKLELRVVFGDEPAEWVVEVINRNGQRSNAYRFQVVAQAVRSSQSRSQPKPRITGIAPSRPVGINGRQTVIVHGEHFDRRAEVTLFELTHNLTFENRRVYSNDGSQIELRVNFTDEEADWAVEVANPDGQTSGKYRFHVDAPSESAARRRPSTRTRSTPDQSRRPRITGITPSRPVGMNGRQTVIVHGEHFDRRARVDLFDVTYDESFENRDIYANTGSQIELHVNFTDEEADWAVEVINPGGQSSGKYRFHVDAPNPPTTARRPSTRTRSSPSQSPRPRITGITPSRPVGSNVRQSVIVRGEHFDRRARVNLFDLTYGEPFENRDIYANDGSQIELRVNFTDEEADWAVEVINPDGQSSGKYRFHVRAPISIVRNRRTNQSSESSSKSQTTHINDAHINTIIKAFNATSISMQPGEVYEFTAEELQRNPDLQEHQGEQHKGVDLIIGERYISDPITNPFHGAIVVKIDTVDDSSPGKNIILELPVSKDRIQICHMERIDVEEGWVLAAGHILGLEGKTGAATGYHAHIEPFDDFYKTNPNRFWEMMASNMRTRN